MPKRFGSPRNEASRRDRIRSREYIKSASRNIKSRNDMIYQAPHSGLGIATLSGTAIAGGVLESEIVTGAQTIIVTLSGGDTYDSSVATTGAQDVINGITGDGDFATVAALMTDSNISRTSDTVLQITLPATAAYAIALDEIVIVALPASAITNGGGVPPAPKTFVITEGS